MSHKQALASPMRAPWCTRLRAAPSPPAWREALANGPWCGDNATLQQFNGSGAVPRHAVIVRQTHIPKTAGTSLTSELRAAGYRVPGTDAGKERCLLARGCDVRSS